MILDMEKDILFMERQRFDQWWLWLVLLSLDCTFIYILIEQNTGGKPLGDKPMTIAESLITIGITVFFTLMIFCCQLETQIKHDGIYVRFFPFHSSPLHYGWKDINKAFLRQYSPLAEYGGWGLRSGPAKNGRAFNISGNQGLQLQLTDDRKLLIGTKRPGDLAEVLDKLGQLKG